MAKKKKILWIIGVAAGAALLLSRLVKAKAAAYLTDDAYVHSGYWDTTYDGNTLSAVSNVDDTYDHTLTYLRINLSSITAPVLSAFLKVYVKEYMGLGQVTLFDVGSSNWTEETLTYSNKPVGGTIIQQEAVLNKTGDMSIDITDFVNAHLGEAMTLAISPHYNQGAVMDSKEGMHPPRLEILK